MQLKHTLLLIAIVGGLGTALSALPNWQAALTPGVIGGLLVNLSASIAAVFIEKPKSNDSNPPL